MLCLLFYRHHHDHLNLAFGAITITITITITIITFGSTRLDFLATVFKVNVLSFLSRTNKSDAIQTSKQSNFDSNNQSKTSESRGCSETCQSSEIIDTLCTYKKKAALGYFWLKPPDTVKLWKLVNLWSLWAKKKYLQERQKDWKQCKDVDPGSTWPLGNQTEWTEAFKQKLEGAVGRKR